MLKKYKYVYIGSFLIVASFILYVIDFLYKDYNHKQELEGLNNYYIKEINQIKNKSNELVELQTTEKIKEKYQYIAVLKIPKINLEKGLVDINSKYNNVKYNIEIIKGSSMPNIDKGNLILASHSGNSKISYFKNLNKLKINDDVIIKYQGNDYIYKVKNIYEIEKTGKASILKNNEKKTLTLITCKHNTNKQIVIICELND